MEVSKNPLVLSHERIFCNKPTALKAIGSISWFSKSLKPTYCYSGVIGWITFFGLRKSNPHPLEKEAIDMGEIIIEKVSILYVAKSPLYTTVPRGFKSQLVT